MLRAGFVAVLAGDFVVVLERLLGRFEVGGEHDVRIAMLSRPLDRVAAHDARNPDLRVWILNRPRPRIDVAEVVVLAFPAERAGGRPGLDYEVVSLLEALPVEGRLGVVRHRLAAAAAHPASDQASAGDHVDLGERLSQPERVFPDREDVAEQHDLGVPGDARENRRLDVHHRTHAEGRRVMFVQHQRVEAHFLGVELLVEIAVIEVSADPGVVGGVAGVEVGDIESGRPEEPGLWVLVGSLGEVADHHGGAPVRSRAVSEILIEIATGGRVKPSPLGEWPESVDPPSLRQLPLQRGAGS